MLYAMGDSHGIWAKLDEDNFLEQRVMTKSVCVLILGDFGIWNDYQRERSWLDWLSKLSFYDLIC